jgi:plastocyanin
MLRQLATFASVFTVSAGLVAPAEAAVIEVTITKMVFGPIEISAQIGDTIEWVNTDFVAHTATARDKTFDVLIPAHGKGSFVVKAAGAFDYFCRFHPMMKGTIQIN